MGFFTKNTAPKTLIVEKRDFISADLPARYLEFAASTDRWDLGNAGTRWDGRVIHSTNMPPDLEQLTIGVLSRLQATISAEFPAVKEIYPDGLSLVRWLPGDFQEPHADAENPDGQEHPFWWRQFGALIYLNRDFEGGDLYFPNKQVRVKPVPRTLVLFPGTMEYLHEVEKITSGIRYTLASFWTTDPARSIYRQLVKDPA